MEKFIDFSLRDALSYHTTMAVNPSWPARAGFIGQTEKNPTHASEVSAGSHRADRRRAQPPSPGSGAVRVGGGG